MTGRSAASALALLALCQLALAENSSNLTNAPGDAQATDPKAGVMLKVAGRSGQFSVFSKSKGEADPNKVTIKMDALYEVDAAGELVGNSGATKHSIQTFAAQDFTISPSERVAIGTAEALKVSFRSPVSSVGEIAVDTFIVTKAGVVGPVGDSWNASAGDLKWSISFNRWSWCGCKQGSTQQVGAFIDVYVVVKGRGNAPSRAPGKKNTFDLGGSVLMELTNKTMVDGAQTEMPEGYPKVVQQNMSTTFVFRFPKFASNATYDPLLRTSASDSVANYSFVNAAPNRLFGAPGALSLLVGAATSALLF